MLQKCCYPRPLPIKLPTERFASNVGHLFLILSGNRWFIDKAFLEVIIVTIHRSLLLPKHSWNAPFAILDFTLNLSEGTDQFPLLIKSSLPGFDSVDKINFNRWILWKQNSVCFMTSINHLTCPKIMCSKQVSDKGVACVRSVKNRCAGGGPAGDGSTLLFDSVVESWRAYGCNNEESFTRRVSTAKVYLDDAMIWGKLTQRRVFCLSLLILPCVDSKFALLYTLLVWFDRSSDSQLTIFSKSRSHRQNCTCQPWNRKVSRHP